VDKEQLSMGKKYYTITYGCQMNESDTERINGQLEELGYRPAEEMEDADIVIMNTCSVRQNAEEKVYGKIGEIKKLKDKNPDMLLGIAGCMAQENKGKLIERMPIIDFVIGPYHIHDLKDIVSKENARGRWRRNSRGHYQIFRRGSVYNCCYRPFRKTDRSRIWSC